MHPEREPVPAPAVLVLGYIPRTRTSMVGKFLSATERILYTLLFGGFPRFQGIMMLRRELLRELRCRMWGSGTADFRTWGVC